MYSSTYAHKEGGQEELADAEFLELVEKKVLTLMHSSLGSLKRA
jgi:hypothetical protein